MRTEKPCAAIESNRARWQKAAFSARFSPVPLRCSEALTFVAGVSGLTPLSAAVRQGHRSLLGCVLGDCFSVALLSVRSCVQLLLEAGRAATMCNVQLAAFTQRTLAIRSKSHYRIDNCMESALYGKLRASEVSGAQSCVNRKETWEQFGIGKSVPHTAEREGHVV
eukprot:3843147-Amphidinium_carterae.1